MKFSLISEELVNKALQLYLDKGQWSKAADQYKKLIKLHPENVTLRLRIAEVCFKGGNKKEALEQYQKVADHYASMEDYPRAVTILRTMLNIDSTVSNIRIRLAELYAKLGDTENMWNQYITTFKYLEEKKLNNQAVAVLEQMARSNTKNTELMLQLAEMFMARNLRPQAMSQYLSVAECFLQKKKFAEAIKYYKEVLKLDTGNREAKIGLEVLGQLDIGKPSPAPPTAEETPDAKEKAPSTQHEPEKQLTRQQLPEADMDDIMDGILSSQTVAEDDLQSRYKLGILYQEMALLDAAIDEFVYAAVDPVLKIKCYQMLSICFEQKGMLRQAQKYRQLGFNPVHSSPVPKNP
jgi:tetratricopeptide (TPR) repeat protein